VIGAFDLVGLQEADAGSLRSGFLNQTQYLAEAAEFPYWTHQPNRRVSRLATSSNGLLARWQPKEVLDYPLPGRIPGRGALWTRFADGASELVVVIAHLSLGQAARARQLAFLAELIDKHPNVVLMGDLNCAAHGRDLEHLYERTSLRPPDDSPATFPSWRPTRALDHILVSDSLQVEKRWVVPHPVSDHLPIAASVRLPEVPEPRADPRREAGATEERQDKN
jgi:endonuclease/exonuclease/phosphatase family metal-dependent hydrolase